MGCLLAAPTSDGINDAHEAMNLHELIEAKIKAIALQISRQHLALACHKPKEWAGPLRCFENVTRQVHERGGRSQSGWIFHHRLAETLPGCGYVVLVHHAVWHAPDGRMIDITLYANRFQHPIVNAGNVLFLLDDGAQLVRTGAQLAPLPMQFYALDEADAAMVEHVAELNRKEVETTLKV